MRIKRKISALILLAIYVLSSGTAPEFFKLPVLVSHYYDHCEENRSVTLTAYLMQHYFYEDGTDTDAEEDNKLPFKSADNNGTASQVSLVPVSIAGSTEVNRQKIKNIFGIYRNRFVPSQYLKNIWQPPRPCSALTA